VIIKARAGTGGAALARYLEQGKNDHAELLELRNLDAASLSQALYFMDTLAKGSHAKNHALHVQLRAAPGERLSADHWREAADRYAEAFGMQEHQAALVLHHQPDGATHCHLVINRVHPETLKAAHLSQNYAIHKRLARQMEQDWGLQQVSSQKRDQPRDYSNASHGEQEQAKRAGEDPHAIRERIRSAWERAENGESFAQELQGEGFTLAQGERRDYVAVDDHGHPYSIGSRTTGATAATVRAKLADLNPDIIPTLAEVKESQQEARTRPSLARDFTASADHSRQPSPRYYTSEARRIEVWEAAAAGRIERMKARHARAEERQQRGFEQGAALERGETVKDFNHLQRHDLTHAMRTRHAEELAAEQQRQQARRDQREQWASKQVWREHHAEQRETLSRQQEEREERERQYRGGFKTRLREELTRQRHQGAHVGATNDRTERPTAEAKPPAKTRAEQRADEMKQVRGQRRRRLKPEPGKQ
jgi:hypothetical protein